MSDVLPQRNLPELAEQWARVSEQRAGGVRKAARAARMTLDGYNRSNAAITADLARRVQKLKGAAEDLEQAAEDLEEALRQVPVVKQLSVYNSDFTIPSGWRERGGGVFVVPEGMTKANIVVVGQALLWDEGSGGGGGGGGVPDNFTAVSNDGTMTINFTPTMLNYAYRIFQVASGTEGVGRQGTVISFMTVFVESTWLMYANSTVPDSLNYPHDAVGHDNDSLGLFQQRPSVGWGSVAELMNVEYNAQAFLGGPNGPNYPSPPGLLDIPGWQNMGYGQAAQAVQVSAFPERYDNWRNASEELYDAIVNAGGGSTPVLQWPFTPLPSNQGGDMPPDGSSDQELAEYGPRQFTGAFHEGMDFGYGSATAGAIIRAAGSGTVHTNQSGFMGYGNTIIIDHGQDSNGNTIYTLYAHRQDVGGPGVGQSVQVNDVIGHVGNTGNSFGAHLHYEIHVVPPGGDLTWDYQNPSYDSPRTTVDPRDYMNYGGGPPGGNPGPGPTPSYDARYGRLVIGGQVVATPPSEYSETPKKVMVTGSGGRTMDVSPGDEIRVQFQARATTNLPANPNTYAGFTAFGVFSP